MREENVGPRQLGSQAKFYPLNRIRLGVWESRLQLDGQIFALVLPKKFVYVVVHPAREISSPTHNQQRFIDNLDISELSWQKQKKQILRLFGSRNPFTTLAGDKVDFYGVVTFELSHDEIGGMECTNSLIPNASRLVFEAKTLRKKAFVTLEDFFVHYELEQRPNQKLHYLPTRNQEDNKIQLRTCWQTMQSFDKADPQRQGENNNTDEDGDIVTQENISQLERESEKRLMNIQQTEIGASLAKDLPNIDNNRNSSLLVDKKQRERTISLLIDQKQDQHSNGNFQEKKISSMAPLALVATKETDDCFSVGSKDNWEAHDKLSLSKKEISNHKSQRHRSRQPLQTSQCIQIQNKEHDLSLSRLSSELQSYQLQAVSNLSDKSFSQAATNVSNTDDDQITGKPVNEVDLKEITIIAYYEDPGFPQALKELLYKPENHELLLQFEQSLPSWTIVLASYTGYYRPWMRHAVKVICFIVSCITLSIACYDLYKNFPLFRGFLDKYFSETHAWIEEIFHSYFAALMGCFLQIMWPLQCVYVTLQQSVLFQIFYTGAMKPVLYISSLLWSLLQLVWDVIWPVKALVSFIFRSSWIVIWNVICLPYTIVYTILYCVYSSVFSFYNAMKTFKESFSSVTALARSTQTVQDTQEAFSMIAYGTQLCITWSQSITNKVFRACKAVYDFIVYVACEIGKHNYTIQVAIYDKTWILYCSAKEKIKKIATYRRRDMFFKSVKYLFYGWMIFFLLNIIIVFLRERFELHGCVLCLDRKVDKISALLQEQKQNFVDSQIRDGLEPNNTQDLLIQAAEYYFIGLKNTLNSVMMTSLRFFIHFYEENIVKSLQ